MMNEIPFTRDGLRHGLTTAVERHDIQLVAPPFWQQNHSYCSQPNTQQGDLWLYENRVGVHSLLDVIKAAFAYVDFRPATTEVSALKAQTHLRHAYDTDEGGIRTFLQQPPLYLDTIIQGLISASISDAQPLSDQLLTPPQLHDALQALLLLGGLLSKQPVPQAIRA